MCFLAQEFTMPLIIFAISMILIPVGVGLWTARYLRAGIFRAPGAIVVSLLITMAMGALALVTVEGVAAWNDWKKRDRVIERELASVRIIDTWKEYLPTECRVYSVAYPTSLEGHQIRQVRRPSYSLSRINHNNRMIVLAPIAAVLYSVTLIVTWFATLLFGMMSRNRLSKAAVLGVTRDR